jgi:Flp pilus assembly pilin Flp
MAEYAVLLAVIAIVVLVGIKIFSTSTKERRAADSNASQAG